MDDAHGNILHYQLLHQILGITRYNLYGLQRKAINILARLPSFSNRIIVLQSITRKNFRFLVVICLNLAVHVLMYAYYALTSMGIRCPWKKMVTVSQIVQFIIDLFVVYFASWNYWAYHKWNMPSLSYGTCSGEETAALSGMGVLSSYLVLFVIFYRNTYKKKQAGVSGKPAAAVTNGKAK
ncbi:hypothetical protein L7F22_042043 [Adiantum nelumboides]|nr:hypothetical protein [Adiantum nelumboides]